MNKWILISPILVTTLFSNPPLPSPDISFFSKTLHENPEAPSISTLILDFKDKCKSCVYTTPIQQKGLAFLEALLPLNVHDRNLIKPVKHLIFSLGFDQRVTSAVQTSAAMQLALKIYTITSAHSRALDRPLYRRFTQSFLDFKAMLLPQFMQVAITQLIFPSPLPFATKALIEKFKSVQKHMQTNPNDSNLKVAMQSLLESIHTNTGSAHAQIRSYLLASTLRSITESLSNTPFDDIWLETPDLTLYTNHILHVYHTLLAPSNHSLERYLETFMVDNADNSPHITHKLEHVYHHLEKLKSRYLNHTCFTHEQAIIHDQHNLSMILRILYTLDQNPQVNTTINNISDVLACLALYQMVHNIPLYAFINKILYGVHKAPMLSFDLPHFKELEAQILTLKKALSIDDHLQAEKSLRMLVSQISNSYTRVRTFETKHESIEETNTYYRALRSQLIAINTSIHGPKLSFSYF
ncbi:hypothetical protein [Helicobacter suis]|uniref:hypothetical protein n=1 Tax=Helicobacter suis TaxID=104628 RepID=UPI0013D00E09|nr:hypothetical protein [Helicobacter suis]